MSWLEDKKTALRDAECVVVKVGSAVLSTASALDESILDNLADQLVRLQRGEDRGEAEKSTASNKGGGMRADGHSGRTGVRNNL